MSYRDKQSRIRFAISAYFVILGSTVSNALPTQAVTEDVEACKAISNDQQRLKCFDDLFANKPNPPDAADKSASDGNWQIEESQSPTDGSPQVVAANLVGDMVLILRCKDHSTEAAFQPSTITLAIGLLTYNCASMTKIQTKKSGKRQ